MARTVAKAPIRRSAALDVLRVIAALWVVVFHWGGGIDGARGIPTFAHLGYMGVDLFFMLSGAVIIHTAIGRSWSEFAQRRFLRLFPVYFIATSAMLVWILVKGQRDFDASLLIQPFGLTMWLGYTPIVGVAWTLLYEVNFYLLVAVLILVRKRIDEPIAMRAVQGFLVVALLALWTNEPLLGALTLRPYGPLFAFGAAIGLATTARELRVALPTVIVAGVMSYQVLIDRVAQTMPSESTQAAWAVGILLFATLFLVWDRLVKARPERTPRVRAGLTTLSLMTYPIYLLHVEFGLRFLNFFVTRGLPPVFGYAFAGSVMLLVCWIIVRFVEPIARRWLRRFFTWDVAERRSAIPARR